MAMGPERRKRLCEMTKVRRTFHIGERLKHGGRLVVYPPHVWLSIMSKSLMTISTMEEGRPKVSLHSGDHLHTATNVSARVDRKTGGRQTCQPLR